MGLNDVPSAGDIFEVVDSEKEARLIVAERLALAKSLSQARKKVSLEDLFSSVQAGEAKELNLIVKADVQGSLDPIVSELNKLEKVRLVSRSCMPKRVTSVITTSCSLRRPMRS